MKKVCIVMIAGTLMALEWQELPKIPIGRADDIAIGYTPPPQEDQRIYVADQYSWRYKSTDGGLTWDSLPIQPPPAHRPNNPIAIVCDPNNAKNVWIARSWPNENPGVFYSSDEGNTWRRGEGIDNSHPKILDIFPSNTTILFAGCEYEEGRSMVYKSTDGGATWNPLPTQPFNVQNFILKDIEVHPLNEDIILICGIPRLGTLPRGIWKTTDGGNTWVQVLNIPIYDMEFSPQEPGEIYAMGGPNYEPPNFSSYFLYKSEDGGNTWFVVYSFPESEFPPSFVRVYGNTIYVGIKEQGLWRSQDGGNTWVLLDASYGIYDRFPNYLEIDPRNPDFLVLGTDGCIYVSNNGGENWIESRNGMRKSKAKAALMEMDLPNRFYLSVGLDNILNISQRNITATPGRIFLLSTDMGNEWKLIGHFPTGGGGRALKIDPINSDKIFGVYERVMDRAQRIVWTEDAGITWNEVLSVPSATILSKFEINPAEPQKVYWVKPEPPQFYKSTDGGYTWTPYYIEFEGIQPNVYEICIDPFNYSTIYLGCGRNGGFGVIKSLDEGQSWERIGLNDRAVHSLCLDPLQINVIYAGTDYGVFKTKNGGTTWEHASSGLDLENFPEIVEMINDPEDPSLLYLTAVNNVVVQGKIYFSPDGGRSWKDITFNLIPDEIRVVDMEIDKDYPDKIFFISGENLYSTQTTWERDQLTTSSESATSYNNARKIAYSIQENTLWAVYKSGGEDYSENGGIFITSSSNEGNTWKEKLEIAEGYAPTIDINPDGDPYVIFSKKDEYGNHGLYGIGRILENNQWPEEPWTIIPPDLTNPILCPSFKIRNDGIGFFSVIKAFWRELCVGYFNTRIINPEIHFLPSPATGADLSWQSLTLLGNGNPAVAYLRVDGGKRVCFRYWRDPLHGWSPEEQVTPDNHIPSYPFIDITPEGNPCIVWVHDNKIFFSQRINGVWTSPLQLSPDNKIATSPQIKRLHSLLVVSWKQEPVTPPNGYYEIAYRTYIPGGWGNVEIVDRGDEYRDFPNIEIKETNIDYKIYFLFTKKSEPILNASSEKEVLFLILLI